MGIKQIDETCRCGQLRIVTSRVYFLKGFMTIHTGYRRD
jgi:hypothetical protein